jgi:hypothetical protein
LESIIQGRAKGLRIVTVPVGVNGKLRDSRLIRSTTEYAVQSALTLVRAYLTYYPPRLIMARDVESDAPDCGNPRREV